MKIRSKMISLVMASLVGIAFCFAGCGSTESELQALKQNIEKLQSKVAEQNTELEELKSENDKLVAQTEKLKDFTKISVGGFIGLKEAFESQALSRDDIKHIIYFMTGEVNEIPDDEPDWSNEDKWHNVNFVPDYALPDIDSKVEFDIKLSYYTQNYDLFQGSQNVSEEIEKLRIEYLGEYDGSYAIRIDSDLWAYGTAVYPEKLGGIVWWQGSPEILVFSYK